jgi:NAD(P)-dependent dehydrogenase (short-subunit alcohol dehydrogenase family)
LSERLAQELAPFGIRVAIIEPGLTRSAIFAKNIDAANLTGADDAPYRRMFQFYAAGFAQATDHVEVAEVIRHAIETDHPQLRYQVSWVAGPSSMDAPRSATTPGSPSAPSRTTTLTTPASRSCLTSTSPH